jgi:hypothetical protein
VEAYRRAVGKYIFISAGQRSAHDVKIWQAMGMCYQDLNKWALLILISATPPEANSYFKCTLLGSRALLDSYPPEKSLNLKIAALHDFLEMRSETVAYHRRCIELSTAERPVPDLHIRGALSSVVGRWRFEDGGRQSSSLAPDHL